MNKLGFYTILLAIITMAGCGTRKADNSADRLVPLRSTIDSIISAHEGKVGVGLIAGRDTLAIGDSLRLPLMSVFKLHIAIAVLDKGLAPDSVIEMAASDLHPDTWSPLRDSTGIRDISIPVGRLLYYSVCRSDNNACDKLIELAGGINKVDSCARRLTDKPFELGVTEHSMFMDHSLTYRNWSSPLALCEIMEAVYSGRALRPAETQYLTGLLSDSSTGREKIAGGVPKEAFLGHKSGLSFRTPEGIRMTSADVAAIRLRDGRTAYLSIVVKDTPETDEETARLFKEIAEAVYTQLH